MSRNIMLMGAVFLLLFLLNTTYATVWYVHQDSALSSIQAGLDSCAANDTVLVASGTYYENISWPEVAGIKLLSESGPDSTMIDGDSSGRVMTMPGSFIIDSSTVIQGFTLQNGSSDSGGAIYCFHASPTISGNNLINNYAFSVGGAIQSHNANPRIIGNIVSNNHACFGGGIHCTTEDDRGMSLTEDNRTTCGIINNVITHNEANVGGGIFWYNEWGTEVSGNTITDNHAAFGGGIFCYYAESCIMTDNVIASNLADSAGGGIHLLDYSGEVTYNTIAENDAGIRGSGIYCEGFCYPMTISHNDIYNNGCGLFNANITQVVNAENNWWGDATGPYHPDSNPGGLGDSVGDYVDFIPWLYEPFGVEEHLITNPQVLLLDVFPNPFSKLTKISFGIGHPDRITRSSYGTGRAKSVELSIYDAAGRMVRQWDYSTIRLSDQITWHGVDNTGQKLPSGVYFLKFTVGDYEEAEKLLLIR